MLKKSENEKFFKKIAKVRKLKKEIILTLKMKMCQTLIRKQKKKMLQIIIIKEKDCKLI